MSELPKTLILMRHGRTHANDLYSARRRGLPIDSELEAMVEAQPDWKHALNDKGVEQARAARVWLEQYMGGIAAFGPCWTSPFVRARQTAAILSEGTEVQWRIDDMLSEQHYGESANIEALMNIKSRIRTGEEKTKSLWSFYFNGGENHTQLDSRFRGFVRERLMSEVGVEQSLIVAHAGLINVARYHFESMLPEDYDAHEMRDHGDVANGALLMYTRQNPNNQADVRDAYQWRRLVRPMQEITDGSAEWDEFPSVRTYTSADLLEQINNLD